MKPTETRQCLTCSSELHGRSDKKFCDDQCRTIYNNRRKTEGKTVKQINSILRRNRRILEQLIPSDGRKAMVSSRKLSDLGFNYSYYTHICTTRAGASYVFCYEYGYMKLENNRHLLIRQHES